MGIEEKNKENLNRILTDGSVANKTNPAEFEFSVPVPKLGTVTVKDDKPFFAGTFEHMIKYVRKLEFEYTYGKCDVSGKAVLNELLQDGSLKMDMYLKILPCLDDLGANVEIILE